MTNTSNGSPVKSSGYIKFIIGGIVAACLVAAWVVEYFQPILFKKYEIMRLENERVTIGHQISEYNLQKASLGLEEENNKIKQEMAALIEKNKKLETDLANAADATKNLKDEMASLQKTYREAIQMPSLSSAEKQRLTLLERETNDKIAHLNSNIEQFELDRKDVAESTSRLREELDQKNEIEEKTDLFRRSSRTFPEKELRFDINKTDLSNHR